MKKRNDMAVHEHITKPVSPVRNQNKSLFFQPKLTVNEPGDQYEQEADAMADKVMRMPANDSQTFFKPAISTIQRINLQREEEEKKVNRKESQAENYISSLEGKGQALTQKEKSFFEPKFGHDFSNVRLHTDSDANQSAKDLNALAYTAGNNIVFGSHQYLPGTDAGKRIMAHELTHVIQQGPAQGIQRIQCISANDSPRYEDAVRREEETNVQTKQANDLVIQRLSAKDSSGGPDLIHTNVAPWGGTSPTGDEYNVYTDASSQVPAWVGISYQNEADRYWCHGHSLGTYSRWLYSVYSGTPMQTTMTDEYITVPEANVQNGDIAVWEPSFGHSCKIESVARSGSAIDPAHTGVSTKNGKNPLASDMLANVMSTYASLKSSVVYHRHR